jgi:hypothetical protein
MKFLSKPEKKTKQKKAKVDNSNLLWALPKTNRLMFGKGIMEDDDNFISRGASLTIIVDEDDSENLFIAESTNIFGADNNGVERLIDGWKVSYNQNNGTGFIQGEVIMNLLTDYFDLPEEGKVYLEIVDEVTFQDGKGNNHTAYVLNLHNPQEETKIPQEQEPQTTTSTSDESIF